MHTKFLYSYSKSSIQPHPTACFSKRRPRVCLRSSQYLLHSMLMISSEGETSKGSGGQINLCMSVGTWPARETVQYIDIALDIAATKAHNRVCNYGLSFEHFKQRLGLFPSAHLHGFRTFPMHVTHSTFQNVS